MPIKPKRIRRNLKTSLKIQVVCEGDTEYSYLYSILKGLPNDTLTELSKLGYVKGNTVNTFLNNQHGSIDIAKQHVNSTRIYYSKPNISCKYGLYKEFLNERQSTLGNLLPYIEELNRS